MTEQSGQSDDGYVQKRPSKYDLLSAKRDSTRANFYATST